MICLADGCWRNRPFNLRAFTGMKLLILSDEIGEQPAMAELFPYVTAESFDRVMFRQDENQLLRLLSGLSRHPFPVVPDPEQPVPMPSSTAPAA